MLQTITITNKDILQQVKLSCQIPEIVEEIVSRNFIVSAAKEAGIKVETEELQKAADLLRLMNGLTSADNTWKWLDKYGLSLDDFEEMVYYSSLIAKLTQHLFAEKIEPYFFEHQLDFAGVVIYEVILEDEDLALELFYAIKEGEMSFFDVAHKYIQDTELRRKGGYLGILRRQDLKPEISAAVFAAKPPQILKPIVTLKGLHLVFVEEIIQAELDDNLRHKIASQLFAEWLKEQVQEVEVIREP
ncbi:MAG: peptidylprolyl isomerase [Nostoc sp. CreGUA01]|nr:peptidylprolyl isomerase [Nostoc sp. CreGUA01]